MSWNVGPSRSTTGKGKGQKYVRKVGETIMRQEQTHSMGEHIQRKTDVRDRDVTIAREEFFGSVVRVGWGERIASSVRCLGHEAMRTRKPPSHKPTRSHYFIFIFFGPF